MNFWQTLPQPIFGLSPMDGVTDAAFRQIVAAEGRPDVVFTEFTNVSDICRGPDAALSTFLYSGGERPIVAQLYGKQPDLFYQAAHIVCELGFDGIDINMGCPSKNVASSGSGAGLIRTPPLAHDIMRAVQRGVEDWANGQTLDHVGIKASKIALIRAMNIQRSGSPTPHRRLIPVSVKTRIGYDAVIIEDWVGHLLEQRPAVISVHGRTLQQMYRGEADWAAIARAAQLTQGTETLLFGNGDVRSLGEAMRRVRETGVHGILVGRGVLGSPWFFDMKEAARASVRSDDTTPHRLEYAADSDDRIRRFRVMVEHARVFEALFGRSRFPRMRKHLGWYCKGFPHAAALRNDMVRASSSEDVERLLATHAEGSVASLPQPSPASMGPPALTCA